MRVLFVGGGNMATALIGGLLQQGFATKDIDVVEVLAAVRERLVDQYDVCCHESAEAPVHGSDVVVLAVKPQQMREAVVPLEGGLTSQVVISIAAGIRLADLSRWLGGYRRLVRAMPNTPALIGAGITGLYADEAVDAAQRTATERILAAVGKTLWVGEEGLMDAVTAVSGSGPAYVFYFIEALAAAARELGLTDEQARTLSVDTFLGATKLAAASGEDVGVLRQRVTSKGGTTEAALRLLDADGIGRAIVRAVRAADARGRELGELLGRE
jgi:pyrroline-5-carboxylate reductase